MHPLFPEFPELPLLVALHTAEGKYIYLHEESFRTAGIDPGVLMGRKWQDYAPADDVDAEIAAVGRALASGRPVALPRVMRRWTARTIALDVKITPVSTQRGTTIVLRQARLADPAQVRPRPATAQACPPDLSALAARL